MFLPIALPAPLQAWRTGFFYWRQVWQYRMMLDAGAFEGSKVPYKFLRCEWRGGGCRAAQTSQAGPRQRRSPVTAALTHAQRPRTNVSLRPPSTVHLRLTAYPFPRPVAVVGVVLTVKAIEKGFRGLKEEHLHDYALRKANVAAAEKAMWDEELALHSVEPAVAEASVLRQRMIDWQYRSQPAAHAKVMHKQLMPFVAVERLS